MQTIVLFPCVDGKMVMWVLLLIYEVNTERADVVAPRAFLLLSNGGVGLRKPRCRVEFA